MTIRTNPDPSEPALSIGNAGLVLLTPYLPMFFEKLGLLAIEGGHRRIPDGEPLSRAVHLLQYCVDTRLDGPASELALNQLLCGYSTAQPIAPSIEAAAADLEVCDQLLRAVTAHWTALAQTAPMGLRETFLQHSGRLQQGDNRWALKVQRRAPDVLIDYLPWSFSIVYHPWMMNPIYVTW